MERGITTTYKSQRDVLIREIERLTKRYERRIRDGVVRAISEIRNEVDLKRLADEISSRGIPGAISALSGMEQKLSAVIIDDIMGAFVASGRMIVGLNPAGSIIRDFRLDVLDPQTIAQLKTHNATLIREISEETRRGVVQNLQSNILAGTNPRTAARDFRDSIGLTRSQEKAVASYRTALTQGDPSVLHRALRDSRFDASVRRAIRSRQPLPPDKIDTLVQRYRERFVKLRAETIARTEAMRAISMGEAESLRQAHEQGKINPNLRRFWIATADARTRNHHRSIPEMNAKGTKVNEPFRTPLGPLMYPRAPGAHPANVINCRCRVVYRIIEGPDAVPWSPPTSPTSPRTPGRLSPKTPAPKPEERLGGRGGREKTPTGVPEGEGGVLPPPPGTSTGIPPTSETGIPPAPVPKVPYTPPTITPTPISPVPAPTIPAIPVPATTTGIPPAMPTGLEEYGIRSTTGVVPKTPTSVSSPKPVPPPTPEVPPAMKPVPVQPTHASVEDLKDLGVVLRSEVGKGTYPAAWSEAHAQEVRDILGNQMRSMEEKFPGINKRFFQGKRQINVYLNAEMSETAETSGRTLGQYTPVMRRIRLNTPLIEQTRLYTQDTLSYQLGMKHTVREFSATYPGAFSHEMGHHIAYSMNPGNVGKWRNFYNLKGAEFFRTNVSSYAAVNADEAFAECFSAMMAKDYGTTVGKTLPKEIEEMMEKFLGKRVRTTVPKPPTPTTVKPVPGPEPSVVKPKIHGFEPKAFQNQNEMREFMESCAPAAKLTATEVDVVRDYTKSGYVTVNRSLRGYEKMTNAVKSEVGHIDAAIGKGVIKEDVVLYRGIVTERLDKAWHSIEGSVIKDPGFLSTSLDEQVAQRFIMMNEDPGKHNYVMKIRATKGIRCAGGRTRESELILGRNTKLKVLSKSTMRQGGREIRVIECQIER